METPLPKGVDGAIGLDSLDFIELSIAIEERFAVAMDESRGPGAALRVARHPVPLHRRARAGRMRRVVVTGLGAVSPFGAGVKAFWAGIAAGACAIGPSR